MQIQIKLKESRAGKQGRNQEQESRAGIKSRKAGGINKTPPIIAGNCLRESFRINKEVIIQYSLYRGVLNLMSFSNYTKDLNSGILSDLRIKMKTKIFECENCKKKFKEILRWKFQLKQSYKKRLCPKCDNDDTNRIMNNLNRGFSK
jgi:hypothetical protein